jgi:multiple sugar transport system ATP-binding protein
VTLGFRPESLLMCSEGEGFPVIVDMVEELGSDAFLYGSYADGAGTSVRHAVGDDEEEVSDALEPDLIARVDPRRPPNRGEKVWLKIREGEHHAFSVRDGSRLPV